MRMMFKSPVKYLARRGCRTADCPNRGPTQRTDGGITAGNGADTGARPRPDQTTGDRTGARVPPAAREAGDNDGGKA
jgi:hypothetical protein